MLGLIGSLVGGALGFIGKSKANKAAKQQAQADRYANSPQGIRANAEEAGFNPLTVLESGRSFGAGYAPRFGNALGSLGQGIADAANGYEQIQIQKAELEMERDRLKALQKATMLKPNVPGIYGDRNGRTQRKQDSNSNAGVSRSLGDGGDSSIRDGGADGISGTATPDRYNRVEAPALTVFGQPIYGSGNFTSGQTFEDAVGEGPLSWLHSGAVAADSAAYTLSQAYSKWRLDPKNDPYASSWKTKPKSKFDNSASRWGKAYGGHPYARPN